MARPMNSMTVAAILIAIALPRAAAAEDLLEAPRARQGYYIALGLFSALSYNRDEGEGLGPWGGFSTSLRLGQMITNRIGVGLAIDAGGASGDGQSATLAGLGMAGQYELATNLALHASVGLGVVSLSSPDDDESRGAVGAAYTLGLTYDWFFGSRRSGGWAVTPGAQLRAVPSDEVDAFAAYLGVEVSYWTGLAKNQLALPPAQAF